jgi:hypothetical protein
MRGIFDRFMRAFNRKLESAIRRIERMNLGVEDLSARIEGRFIRLSGVAPSREVATRVIELFRQFAEVDNILDAIKVMEPPANEAEARG